MADDLRTLWTELSTGGDERGRSDQIQRFTAFADVLAAHPDCANAFAMLASPKAAGWQRMLTRLLRGDVCAVGLLPQFELMVLTGLFHISRGCRAFLFSGLPIAPGLYREMIQAVSSVLGVECTQCGHVFGQPRATPKELQKGAFVFADFGLLFEASYRDTQWFEKDRAVALFCELDLCLYDARLGLFENNILQAVAAVCRTHGKDAPWKGERKILDLKMLLPRFEEVGGASSYMTSEVATQLAATYGDAVPGRFRDATGRRFSALCFEKLDEKISTLVKDINTAQGDSIVFYVNDGLRQTLQQELKKRGLESVSIGNPRDLITFLAMSASSARVGFFRGVPTMLGPFPETRPEMNVFVAEHYLMPHQHQKLAAFVERDITLKGRAYIYFCLEDEIFNVYATEGSFRGAFDMIAFTEKYDKWRQVRRVMAHSIMRKIYALRRSCLDEDFPIFTLIATSQSAGRKRQKDGRKKKGRFENRLEGLCFCGSGKPFRECHGRSGSTS